MIILDNLIAYWNSRSGLNGALWNNIAPEAQPLPIQLVGIINGGNGIYFNGSSYGRLAIPTELNTIGQSYTIEMVFTPENVSESSIELFAGSTYTSFDTWGLWSEHFDGNSWQNSIGHWTDYTFRNMLTSLSIVYNSTTNEAKYYVNGQLISAHSLVNKVQWAYGNEVFIGRGLSDTALQGYIHALRIYKKPLSDTEIQQNYTNGLEIGLPEEPGPDPEEPKEPVSNIIARMTKDGNLLIAGRLIKGSDKVSFKVNGDLHVGDIIEGNNKVSFNGNIIYVNSIIEGTGIQLNNKILN